MIDNRKLEEIAVNAMMKYMLGAPKNAEQLIISVCAINDLAKITGKKSEQLFHSVFMQANKLLN